jgi:hypothetical protein
MEHFPVKCYNFILGFLACTLLSIQEGSSQYFFTGTDPSSVKWRQIRTKNFKIIYPRTLEPMGQYVSNGLEYNYVPGSRSLYNKTARTPVIIHNQTTIPSSATYIAPRRMEFFTTPPQDLYPQDWVDQLIIHEFRHAVMYSAIDQGFTRGVHYVLGEQGVFIVFGAFLPMWFIEGDPTVTETALHNTGRGRTPSFEMRLRAQIVDKGIYSYEKANYGSFADFVPGKYELGYQLVGWSRINWGKEVWSNVLNNIARRPYTLVPFSSSLKKQTGFNKYHLYDTITRQIQGTWIAEDKLKRENNSQTITKTSGDIYTSYNLPAIWQDSLIIALKSSLDKITGIVLIEPGGKERKLCNVGANYYTESLSVSDSVIYWSELVNDPRWTLRDYRVIKSFNLISGKTKQITRETRYYAPAVTRDGKYLVAVEADPENNYSLVILNSRDGSLIKKITTPENLLFVHPRWSDDNKSIVSVTFGKSGNSIAITDPETGKTELLIPFSMMEMKRPSFYRNYILYTASYNGKDNIYAVDRNTKKVSRITNSRFGASDAFVSEDLSSIIYSNYTSGGYNLVKERLDSTAWQEITIPVQSAFPLAEALTKQENFIFNTDSVPKINYNSKPYHKVLNLFDFHSWIPYGLSFQDGSAGPGITLISQNLLNTTVSFLGYLYNRNEKTSKYFTSISNETYFTAVDLSADYGGRNSKGIYTLNDSIPEKWNEFNLSAGLRLPLNWTHNYWIRSFQPAVSLSYKFLKMDKSVPIVFEHNEMASVNLSLIAFNKIKMSQRDLSPRWSQYFQLNFNSTPFNNTSNSIFASQLSLVVPGIGNHHNLSLYAGYQTKTSTFYSFSDYIAFPRGFSEIEGKDIYSFSATYSMPLFYPDWQLGHVFYFKRLKSALFYDYAISKDLMKTIYYSSIGLDLSSDFGFINLITPLDAGIRSIFNLQTNRMQFEMIFSINLGSIY